MSIFMAYCCCSRSCSPCGFGRWGAIPWFEVSKRGFVCCWLWYGCGRRTRSKDDAEFSVCVGIRSDDAETESAEGYRTLFVTSRRELLWFRIIDFQTNQVREEEGKKVRFRVIFEDWRIGWGVRNTHVKHWHLSDTDRRHPVDHHWNSAAARNHIEGDRVCIDWLELALTDECWTGWWPERKRMRRPATDANHFRPSTCNERWPIERMSSTTATSEIDDFREGGREVRGVKRIITFQWGEQSSERWEIRAEGGVGVGESQTSTSCPLLFRKRYWDEGDTDKDISHGCDQRIWRKGSDKELKDVEPSDL